MPYTHALQFTPFLAEHPQVIRGKIKANKFRATRIHSDIRLRKDVQSMLFLREVEMPLKKASWLENSNHVADSKHEIEIADSISIEVV